MGFYSFISWIPPTLLQNILIHTFHILRTSRAFWNIPIHSNALLAAILSMGKKNHNAAFMVGLQTIMVVESANDSVIMTMRYAFPDC